MMLRNSKNIVQTVFIILIIIYTLFIIIVKDLFHKLRKDSQCSSVFILGHGSYILNVNKLHVFIKYRVRFVYK